MYEQQIEKWGFWIKWNIFLSTCDVPWCTGWPKK